MTNPEWTQAEWERIKGILDQLLDLPPEEQASILEAELGSDPRLRTAVEELLAAGDAENSVIDQDVERWSVVMFEGSEADSPGSLVGESAGPFELVEELGRGGMGVVYLAERADGQFEQRVALKVLEGGFSSEAMRTRFLAERRILARLDHTGIARIIDGGVLKDGRPYFAMEFVDGSSLTDWLDRTGASLWKRLEVFLAVCDAVGYAHQNLVLHLDLKPANILVTPQAQVKLLDFGIATLIRGGSEGRATAGVHPGALTPDYAAPELLSGGHVSVVTDVYSLGMVLYGLLCGEPPAVREEGEPNGGLGWGDPQLPTPPSVVAGEKASRGSGRLGRIGGQIAGDLDAVVLKALDPDPGLRYGSVAALSADIEATLEGFPVTARPASTLNRARRFVGRHRLGVSAAFALLVALVGGTGATVWQANKARHEAQKAEQVKDYLVGVFVDADPERSDATGLTARELLDRGAERIRFELDGQPEVQSDLLLTMGQVYRNLGVYEAAAPLVEEAIGLREGLFGAGSEGVAEARNELGWIEYLEGAWSDAEIILREVVATRRGLRETESPDLARSIDNLAEALRVQGEYPEAEELAREALALRRRSLGAHVDVATSLNNLGVIVRQTASAPEAEGLFREALEMRRELQGPNHPEAWVPQGNLAMWLREHGEREESKAILENLLESQTAWYGGEHPLPLGTKNNLASLRRDLGELDEAAGLFREVLSGWEGRGGAEHPNAVTSRNNLAAVLREMGRLTEAEANFREVLQVFRTVLGPDHPNTAVATHNLASTLFQAGRSEEAEPLFLDAMEIAGQVWPEGHPLAATFTLGYGRLLEEDGRCASAVPILEEAVGTLVSADTEIIPGSVGEAKMTLGSCLLLTGRPGEAEAPLLDAYRALEGKSDRQLVAIEGLIRLYEELDQEEEAELWRSRRMDPAPPEGAD